MSTRRINSREASVVDDAFQLAQKAQWNGVDKERFAEILDRAWDDARRDQMDRDTSTEIKLS